MATSQSGRPKMMVAVRRLMASSGSALVSALIATVGLASSAMADRAPDFNFNDDGSSGMAALSQPYSGPTPSGQSSGTGVALRASDPSQKVYSLLEANANVGVGACRGGFPASSRTISPSSTTPSSLGPYDIMRRPSDGTIDTAFGDSGDVSAFPTSDNANDTFNRLCIDPGTGKIVIVGQESTSSGTEAVVERLIPPTSGSRTATLDTRFNPGGTTAGVVTISTPKGNNAPHLYTPSHTPHTHRTKGRNEDHDR